VIVTVELARRLIDSGVPSADIEAALLLALERGLPLHEAIAEHAPELLAVVEQQLTREDLPGVYTVRPAPELCSGLPSGMCQRLMAVPIHRDQRSGRVDVAAVDALDPHIGSEFSFHLGAPVRVLSAPREAVVSALDNLAKAFRRSQVPRPRSSLPPARGREPGVRSDAPIPLVRRSMLPPADLQVRRASQRPPAEAPVRRGTKPGVGSGSMHAAVAQQQNGLEPALASLRSKPPPADLAPLVAGASEATVQEEQLTVSLADSDAPTVKEELEAAKTPERVVEILKHALRPALSIVFTVKNASFEARAASPELEASAVERKLTLLSHQPSVLETALKSGFYLGPIPNTPNHRELRDALPADGQAEVYATLVTVAERPSLIWLLAGFERSLDLTRRADEIALAAGRALTRILRSRKRGG
jgi:hypothetical protein